MSEKLYVLGHPVTHSKSPAMLAAAFRELGLNWEYGLADCAFEFQARSFLAKRDWLAVNVTTPWKPLAALLADSASAQATLAQGANVVVNCAGKTRAFNVDGQGAVSFLQRCGCTFLKASVAVCGTGPTSLSILHAAACAGAQRIVMLSRNLASAQSALKRYTLGLTDFRTSVSAQLVAATYDALGHEEIANAHIVIDATPLGMQAADPAVFDTAVLTPSQSVLDVVYGHGMTKLVESARKRGCKAYDGSGMLVAQALETLRVLADTTKAFELCEENRLYALMAKAAGFQNELEIFSE